MKENNERLNQNIKKKDKKWEIKRMKTKIG